jgi:type VI secretion system protein ImpL
MNRIVGMLVSRWTLSLLGTALLAALAWVFGPLLPLLADWPMRLALVLVMLLVWAVANLLLELLRRGRETALETGLTAQTAEETAALRDKLGTALRLLKRTQKSRGYLYEQPWYAIIGPPGAGKTTALLNAGLHFPLAAEMGKSALSGVGGTRLCEWWFTDEAVLIDTAGRYTTQDSNEAVDRAGWTAFLDLLHRTRPRQPLNGVIVAIALSDVARAPPAERLAHAQAIRQRVRELETRFGMRMPVYALFTKADLIAGFTQFFDDLDEAQRAQVWGTTFAMPAGFAMTASAAAARAPVAGAAAAGPAADFAGDFRALVERLNARMYQRLLAEPNLDRRSLIAMFPTQFASLERPLLEFLQAAFADSPQDPALLLRGAYLTSGTQEGTPIDRLLGMMARSFGLDQRNVPSLRPDQGRSYFLNKLLREVIFGEAMLVSRNPAAERRRAMVRVAGFACAALVVLAAGTLLWRIQSGERRQIDAADAALAGYQQAASRLPLDPVADADLSQLVPWLDQARALSNDLDTAAAAPPPWWKLGLSQEAKLAAATHEVYRHALERALLPRLVWRLEAQLRGNMNQPDFLYEATRVYLMLGNAGPLDRNLVHEWMALDWQTSYPGDAAAPMRQALLRHLDTLLAEPLPAVSLDGALVVQARSAFSGVSLAQRAYSRIRPSAAAQSLPPWRPSDALGAAGAGLFVRASGKPLSDGIPGLLTVEGFHKVLLPSLDTAARSVVSESWVLGQRVEFDPNGPQMRALQQQVTALYETDYVRAWDAMLTDLNFAQMRSLPRAAQDLYIVESPESPLRALLVSIAWQLRLSAPQAGATAVTPAPTPAAPKLAATPATSTAAEQVQAALGRAPPAPDPTPSAPGHEIDERYQALLSLVGNGPGAPIDQVMKSLIDIQQLIAKVAAAPVGSAPPALTGNSNPAVALQAEASRLPQPLSRWISSIATSGVALLGGSPADQVAAVFNAPGGPAAACPLAVKGHYPFVRDATNDVSLDDFAQLFAPGGLIDGFVNTLLRPYVDMSGPAWHLQVADGVTAPVSAADLAQFQRAATIRDAFFAAGGTAPSIRFDITPVSVDRTTKQATLDLGGTIVTASHEPPRSTQITWPNASQASAARLAFDPPPAGQTGAQMGALQDTGPWSMFRLFGRGKIRPGPSADRYTLTFQIGDRQATFEIRTNTGPNPFTPGPLQDFRCPEVHGK